MGVPMVRQIRLLFRDQSQFQFQKNNNHNNCCDCMPHSVVPAPPALLLGLLGFPAVIFARRRKASQAVSA